MGTFSKQAHMFQDKYLLSIRYTVSLADDEIEIIDLDGINEEIKRKFKENLSSKQNVLEPAFKTY